MITIYSPQGTSLLALGNIGTGSKGYYSLMQHDYIVLKFSLTEPVEFKRGCYVDLTGQFDDALGGKLAKKYYVVSKQTPTYNTATGGYDYELRLDAYYWLWNNYIFKYLPETPGSEASWSLTAALDVHLDVFLRNLAELGFTFNGTPFTYSIDQTVANKAVAMTYDNTHLLDALFSLGGEEAFDCDVWVTESVIHFGRCELGSAVKIERDVEAESITRSDSKGTFATRIYAFGSTRNIPANYRPIEEQAVVNGVVQKRLMLPNGTPYVDAYEDMADTEVVEDVVVFDDIYPRRVGTLSNVTTRTETVENEDGTQNTYTYYRYKDTGLQFNSDYILEGQELQVTFQSGKLNGMTFGVIFNPDGKKPEEQLWEIVANEDYGRLLPDDTIKPENGDEYVLSGFDIQLVSDQYIPEAEQELLTKAKEYVAKTKIDDGVYTVTLMSDWVYADQIRRTFDVGQKITLVAPDFFTDNRTSRVIGWEMCLDIPYDHPIYTIGESAQYSRLNDIESKVDTLTFKGQTYVGGGNGSGVYVIRTNDSTPASDSNVFSALKSLATFLRKDRADTAHGLITLERGAEFSVYAPGWQGTGAKVDAGGAAEVDSLMVRKRSLFGGLLGSAEFTSGFPGGNGWQLYPYAKTNAAGQEETKWQLEIDGVTVRGTFRVYEMIVNQLRGENDNYIFAGMMRVDHYDPASGRIYLDTEKGVLYNPFREGDILMVQRFGGAEGMSVKQYELRVTAAGTGDLSDGEDRLDWLEFTNLTASVDDIEPRDILVRVDSVTDPTRKGIVTVTTINDTGAPYIDVLYGLKTDPDDATRCRMGNLSGIRTKSGVDLTNVWGLYARGAYIEQSTMVLDNGNTVEQQFQVMDGKLLSEIAEVRAAVQQEGEVLANPSFARDTIHWTADTGTTFYEHRDSLMWDGSEFMAERRGGTVSIAEDGGRNSLLIVASSIGQDVAEMSLPAHAATDPGDPEAGIPADPGDQPPYTYSFSLYIRVVEAGTLTAGIEGSGLWLSKEMQPTEGYEKVAAVGTWDETGAFTIAFTGRAYVRDASLRNDALAGATERLKTIIKQTAEEIKLWAGKEIETATGQLTDKLESELSVMADKIGMCVTHDEFDEKTGELETKLEGKLTVTSERIDGLVTKVDNINGTIEKSGWITKADAQTLFASKTLEDGSTIVSYINQTASSIKISAEHVELDGVVSFSMFDYDTQRIINDIGDAADNAQSAANSAKNTANEAKNTANSASSAASSAQSTANSAASAAAQAKQDAAEALSDAADAYRQAQTAYNNAQTAISNASTATSNANSAVSRAAEAIQSATDALNAATAAQTSVDNLPGWSKEASIVKALQDQTVIAGGFISASMIDVENLFAQNLVVRGSMRSPFTYAGDSFDVDYSDNVAMISEGGGWINAYSLPWDVNQSGRKITIVNYKWPSVGTAQGVASITAPTGKYFFENGIQKQSLKLSRQAVEMLGYGSSGVFYGWIVLKRLDIMTESRYGGEFHCLAMGMVTGTGSGASIKYKTFDGTTMNVTRISEGQYNVTHSSMWFADAANDRLVMLTGKGGAVGGREAPIKATYEHYSSSLFKVYTSDDETENDGSFQFMIFNLSEWTGLV